MDPVLLIVALGAMIAGFVQGLSGFAFGLVAMSIWVWVLDPKIAAALTVFGALIGQIIATFSVRRGFNFKLLLPFVLGGLVGIPFGILLLPQINTMWFKVFIGTLLVVWCPIMLFSNHLPTLTISNRFTNAIVGMIGGAMSALGGFSGVIPTLWCTLCGYNRDTQRAIIQNFNLSMLAVTMATYVGTGMITQDVLMMFVIVGPAMLIPTFLGTRLYIGISDALFRQIVLSLLTLSGIALLSASLPLLF